MGYHYFNKELIDDLVVDVCSPRAWSTRRRRTGASSSWPWSTSSRVPTPTRPGSPSRRRVLGMQMHILVPAVGFYILHAWVWGHNPAGMFADWNPEVSCP